MTYESKKNIQHFLINEKKLRKELESLCWKREAEGYTEETGLYNSPEIKMLIRKLQDNRKEMVRLQKRKISELSG